MAGGRIPDFVKTQEFRVDSLYCEACDEDFRDENAMGLHERSNDHRKNLAYIAKEANAERTTDNKLLEAMTSPEIRRILL